MKDFHFGGLLLWFRDLRLHIAKVSKLTVYPAAFQVMQIRLLLQFVIGC